MRRTLIVTTLALLLAAPVVAQDTIAAGPDVWATPAANGTYVTLGDADWRAICGAKGRDQQIFFKGDPFPDMGNGATVIDRLEDATLAVGDSVTITVRLSALELVSTDSSDTPCGTLDFRLTAADLAQQDSLMTIVRTSADGGVYHVDLAVDVLIEAYTTDGAFVGSVIKSGILEDQPGGQPWAFDPPPNPLDPNADWYPGVTASGTRANLSHDHSDYAAKHAYQYVTFCENGTVETVQDAETGVIKPACPEPVPVDDAQPTELE